MIRLHLPNASPLSSAKNPFMHETGLEWATKNEETANPRIYEILLSEGSTSKAKVEDEMAKAGQMEIHWRQEWIWRIIQWLQLHKNFSSWSWFIGLSLMKWTARLDGYPHIVFDVLLRTDKFSFHDPPNFQISNPACNKLPPHSHGQPWSKISST